MSQLRGTAFTNFIIGAPDITAELSGVTYDSLE